MKPFSVFLIPDDGDAITKHGFPTAVAAQSSGVAEAKMMFKTTAAMYIEIVVTENHEAVPGMELFARRDN